MRIIIDSQSNRLFQGSPLEQNYDQRGGLCQVGEGDLIITTNPIDEDYLEYWKGLGFSIPWLLVAGPYDPELTLSELIAGKPDLIEKIRILSHGKKARLEFFCIEEEEKLVSNTLRIPGYCNFDFSMRLSRKVAFKCVCEDLGLVTPKWMVFANEKDMTHLKKFISKEAPVLLKANDGTGGIVCGGMLKIESADDLHGKQNNKLGHCVLVEKLISPKEAEISLHWEINERGECRIIGIFGQLSENFGYSGTFFPDAVDHSVKAEIEETFYSKFLPYLLENKALGFFCCDIVVGAENVYWIDFNPRKGAILYIYDMARRLSEIRREKEFWVWHQHMKTRYPEMTFRKLQDILGNSLIPTGQPLVVVTNPGVISYGYADISVVSWRNMNEARDIFKQIKEALT